MKLSPYMESYRLEVSPRLRLIYWRSSGWLAWSLLAICFRRRTRNRAEHIRGLEEKVARQALEISNMQRSAKSRNAERMALNLLVACDGQCNRAYMADPSQVTDEVVRLAERNATRLRHWWNRGGQAAAEAYRGKFA